MLKNIIRKIQMTIALVFVMEIICAFIHFLCFLFGVEFILTLYFIMPIIIIFILILMYVISPLLDYLTKYIFE